MIEQAPDKLLIVLLGAIGDVVRALPLAARIKSNWPNTKIHWAVEPASKGVLEVNESVDKIILFKRQKGLPAYFDFIKELKSEKYALVLDLQRHFKSGLTSFLTGAKDRVGFSYKGSRELNWIFNNHKIGSVEKFSSKLEQFQKFADVLGLPQDEKFDFKLDANVSLKPEILESLNSLPGSGKVALIISSTWPSRYWVSSYYSDLAAKMFDEYKLSSVIIAGPGEMEKSFAEEIVSQSKNKNHLLNLTAKTQLSELPSVFSKMKLAIGSDSGPMHIAAASGLPVISLWGSTSPLRSSPYSSEKYVISRNLPCSPCYKKTCPGLDNICMKSISVENVLDNLQEIIRGI